MSKINSEHSQDIFPETKTQIVKKAQKEITDLKTAVSQNLFFDAPQTKLELEAVFDGFTAVANGMDDISSFERMDTISESSIFQPWKFLIYALRAFYHGEKREMLDLLKQIKDETVPSVLKPILRQAAGEETTLTSRETAIFNSIIRTREDTNTDVDKIKECRNAGYFEMLPSLMADYAEKNKNRGEVFTQAIALSCFDAIQTEAPLSFSAIKKFSPVIGGFHAFRLAAVSSLKSYTEQAVFYWIEATNALLDYATSGDWDQIKVLLSIIEEVWQCVNNEYELTDDYRSLLKVKVIELKQKSYSIFGDISGFENNLTGDKSLEDIMLAFSFKEATATIVPEQSNTLEEALNESPSQHQNILSQTDPETLHQDKFVSHQSEKKLYTQLEFAF